VTDTVYIDTVENYAVPQVPDGCILQEDGLPHFRTFVTESLNEQFTGIGIG
jgi:hypothetical protein